MFLIVGLGNPGKQYEAARHNAGFLLVDEFAERHGLRFKKTGLAQSAEGVVAGVEVAVIKPQTFMNRSGEAVAEFLESHPAPPDAILAVYDDCDLPFGRIRARKGGSAGGHRGVESIHRMLAGASFPRMRLGVGRPPSGAESLADYVLAPFDEDEVRALEEMLRAGVDCIDTVLAQGMEVAQNRFNSLAMPGGAGGL